MNVLVIGKPHINTIIPLEKFLIDGSKITIKEKIEEISSSSIYISKMLKSWGINVYYAGSICGDDLGLKIKNDLESFNIDTTFMEIDYEHHTSLKYTLLNKENALPTQILLDNGIFLTKHRYDINPEYIITDGTDMGASIAAANNYPKAKIILLANEVNNDYYNLSKRSHYVCASSNFASALTKIPMDYKAKTLVNIYQKIKDLNKSSYIIMLNNNGVLYAKDLNVKQIPAINVEKKDESNKENAFFAAYSYGIINNLDIDDIAKIANISYSLAQKEIGMKSIPNKEEVFKLAGLKLELNESVEKLDDFEENIDIPKEINEKLNEGTTNE